MSQTNTASEFAFNFSARLAKFGVPQPLPATMIGLEYARGSGPALSITSPIDGGLLAELPQATPADVTQASHAALAAFRKWRLVPAPLRGELVRRIGNLFREHKDDLAHLITIECGKITSEALGEVQEMIDICDFATGLSRQLCGKTITSERAAHRLMEQWHPLGPVGVITAFNFPVAVWSWNAMIGLVCGDPILWKPSEKTPLVALAIHSLAMQTVRSMPEAPAYLFQIVVGGREIGQALAADKKLPLISATGSVAMGRSVAQVVAARLGRSLLELGGNNASIVTESADVELATRAIAFSAVGTCGQRCTSLRRLLVPKKQLAQWCDRLLGIYARLPIGNPLDSKTLVGPLIDRAALDQMQNALAQSRQQGGTVHGGEPITRGVPRGGAYVQPAIVEIDHSAPIVQQETFAPILYLLAYDDFDQAIEIQNGVPQGLASSIFTRDIDQAERFCSAAGSDCGLVNVNLGTSGAEIGGAFGGEKETGGGRESGSDAWQAYMRRATSAVNFSGKIALAQGIQFDV